jgi:hypothetical protein
VAIINLNIHQNKLLLSVSVILHFAKGQAAIFNFKHSPYFCNQNAVSCQYILLVTHTHNFSRSICLASNQNKKKICNISNTIPAKEQIASAAFDPNRSS